MLNKMMTQYTSQKKHKASQEERILFLLLTMVYFNCKMYL